VVNDERLEVRVSVIFAGLVMLVVAVEGSQFFEPLVDVFDQAGLVVIDVNAGGDVHGRDQDHTVFNAGLFEDALNLRREVNVGSLGFRVQRDVFGVEFHGSTFTTGRVAIAANFGHRCRARTGRVKHNK
jgi:hypothetical protein